MSKSRLKIYSRNIILLLILLSGTSYLSGQQLPLYSQYMNNGFLLNPAMAGHDGFTSFNITSRKQWVGFQNSPLTYSVSGQTRLLKKSYRIINRPVKKNKYKPSSKGRVGLGGFVFNDVNGLVARTGAQFTYAYHIYMRQSQLSFGLAGQVFQYKIDMDKVSTYKEDEIKDRVHDLTMCLAEMEGDVAYTEASLKDACALIIGGEAEGASQSARDLAQMSIHIPMSGEMESLNAAIAGAILIFEVIRQRKLLGRG